MTPSPNYHSTRLPGLRRFAVAITILNVLGHTVLGFEQSWAQPIVALGVAYGVELLLEIVDARLRRRRARFLGPFPAAIDFLLPAHISALAVSMLMYANEQVWPFAFAAAAAIGSKAIFHLPPGPGARHFFNPSNFGISLTLLLFPWVGIAPPYQFTENLFGPGDWILPGIILTSGTFLNARFTRRLPLIAAWLSAFAIQALVRSIIFETPLVAGLLPMTGVAFILFTCYMITDPATTPQTPNAQIVFGAGVAVVYGLLTAAHIVFGLFFSLSIVCVMRGALLHVRSWLTQRSTAPAALDSSPVLESLRK